MPRSDCKDVTACEDKTEAKSATVVAGGARGLLWKPYLTVVEVVREEAIMSWSIQFVVKQERPILPSQQVER